jgi:hypothetical protein
MLKMPAICLVLASCAAVVTVALATASRWQVSSQQRLAAAWDQRIAQLPDAQAAAYVRSLRQHDALALRSLAAALGDKRPAVAAASREMVSNLVQNWKGLPARESVPRLIELAQLLAEHYEHFPPSEKQFVRQIAQVMLCWPMESADFAADDLVAQCERILAAPAPIVPELESGGTATAVASEDEGLPPVVSPQVASRPRRPDAEVPPAPIEQQEPAPVLAAPRLSPVDGGEVDPSLPSSEPAAGETEPRPAEPRQFIRPRVPRIPAPDES